MNKLMAVLAAGAFMALASSPAMADHGHGRGHRHGWQHGPERSYHHSYYRPRVIYRSYSVPVYYRPVLRPVRVYRQPVFGVWIY